MTMESLTIRITAGHDIPAVAAIHAAAFPDFFLTRLGPAFVRNYYRQVVEFDAGWLLIAERDGLPIGFVAGFAEPDRFYAGLKRRPWRFLLPLAFGLARRPWLLSRILRRGAAVALRGDGRPDDCGTIGDCELSSLAVLPGMQGQGVGLRLVAAFVQVAQAHQASLIRLTTDARDNDAVNAFYARAGFSLVGCLTADRRRPMNKYEYHLRQAG